MPPDLENPFEISEQLPSDSTVQHLFGLGNNLPPFEMVIVVLISSLLIRVEEHGVDYGRHHSSC
jgi:hypothetical protein